MGLYDDTPAASFFDDFLNKTTKDDFIFSREYKVVRNLGKVRGKWPLALTNSIFIDSKKVHTIYSSMFSQRIMQVLARQIAMAPGGLAQAEAKARF